MQPTGHPVRVLIVDDSELVRLGLRTMLGSYSAVQVVGEAESVAMAVSSCQELKPDLVLMDIRLPDGNGIDACRQILSLRPLTRVLVLSSMVTDSLVQEAIAAGAHGYLLKDIDGQGLVSAILDVAAGKSILDPAVTRRVMQLMKTGQNLAAGRERFESLSPQEQRVLALVAEGLTNKEIAAELKLSEKTVKNYLSNLFDKLQISRRSQAAAFYTQIRAGQN
ncbi:MAG TPA: response regulator transcription factor [Nitrospira sp.]|nr:response regulator transcription factor [Nitrospira sp.]